MNFLITQNKDKTRIENNEEVVIIQLNDRRVTEKVYCYFPPNRFADQEEKMQTFVNHIQGKIDERDGAIETKENSYEIYEAFYSIFY